MPTPTKGARLGGSASHQRLILSNLATSLFEHGKITTTEFLCRHIFEELAGAIRAGQLGDGRRVKKLRIRLHESHVARAWYEAAL